jgi:flagellar hook-basal body complex protein FliE
MNPISSSSLRILPAEAETNAPVAENSNSPEPGFHEVLGSAIDEIQQLGSEADTAVAGVLNGTGTDVHAAMIAVEKADLSFQLMMQVRNKIVSAYEEISRMQF